MGIGEFAGLTAAGLWALSSVFYSRAQMTAWEMNLWKNCLASVIFLIHLTLVRSIAGDAIFEAPVEAWCWLALSSIIGIVIGDTVYFRSLQILGPRRALVVSTASPIFGVIVGYFVMGDTISILLLMGVGLTILGVAIVVSDKKAERENPNVYPGKFIEGFLFGIGGALCQAAGVATAKIGMAHGCEALESSFIRMISAAAAAIGLMMMYPERFWMQRIVKFKDDSEEPTVKDISNVRPEKLDHAPAAHFETRSVFTPLANLQTLKFFVPAAMIGTWLGIWFFQISQQYSETAVVTTLCATCPLFAIPLVWLLQGHRVSMTGILGTLVAVVGIVLVVQR